MPPAPFLGISFLNRLCQYFQSFLKRIAGNGQGRGNLNRLASRAADQSARADVPITQALRNLPP